MGPLAQKVEHSAHNRREICLVRGHLTWLGVAECSHVFPVRNRAVLSSSLRWPIERPSLRRYDRKYLVVADQGHQAQLESSGLMNNYSTGLVAQRTERLASNQMAVGSNPTESANDS